MGLAKATEEKLTIQKPARRKRRSHRELYGWDVGDLVLVDRGDVMAEATILARRGFVLVEYKDNETQVVSPHYIRPLPALSCAASGVEIHPVFLTDRDPGDET
jgi:hypothetical protein